MRRVPSNECYRGLSVIWGDFPEHYRDSVRRRLDAYLDGDPSARLEWLQNNVSIGSKKKRASADVFLLHHPPTKLVLLRLRQNQRILVWPPLLADMTCADAAPLASMEDILILEFSGLPPGADEMKFTQINLFDDGE